MKTGDRLDARARAGQSARRERDPLEWQGHMLGYVPRRDNADLARQMDLGAPPEAPHHGARQGRQRPASDLLRDLGAAEGEGDASVHRHLSRHHSHPTHGTLLRHLSARPRSRARRTSSTRSARASTAAVDGGVRFAGELALCYAVNLESRVASRVLWQVAHGAYRSERDIFEAVRALPWNEWFHRRATRSASTCARSARRSRASTS